MIEEELKCEILPEDYANSDLSFKIIVIGDSGVGKSCLTMKATKNSFEINHQNTVGFEFTTFNIKINTKIVKLQIWDTCGQEIYRSLITGFYRNTSLAIIVYSIDNEDSLQIAENWLRDLRSYSNPDVKIFLIGNKLDLENYRKVPTEEAKSFKDNNELDLFMEASAKTGFNAKAIFVEAAKLLYTDYIKYRDNFSVISNTSSVRKSDITENTNVKLKSGKTQKTFLVINENQKKSCC